MAGSAVTHDKDTCACASCVAVRIGRGRQAAYAEQDERQQALARVLLRLAVRVTGVPGAEALAIIAGEVDAQRILKVIADAAPMPSDPVPVRRQVSTGNLDPWDGEPDHDPRFLEILRQGGSNEQLAACRRAIVQEHREELAGIQSRQNVMWVTRDGETLTSGVHPLQQSSVEIPEPGRETAAHE